MNSDSSDEEVVVKGKVASQKLSKVAAPEADTSDEEVVVPQVNRKAAAQMRADPEDSDDEEAEPPPKAVKHAVPQESKVVVASGDDTSTKAQKKGTRFRIVIKSIPFKATIKSLKKDFATCGEILDLQLPLKDGGAHNKGIAFMSFKTKESFEAAMKLNGNTELYPGRTLQVLSAAEAPRPGMEVSVPLMTTGVLYKMLKAQEENDYKALATIAEMLASKARARDSTPTTHTTQTRSVKKSVVEQEKAIPDTLLVKASNLPFNELDKKAVKKLFAKCGSITDFDVPMKEDKSRGFAIITFDSKEAVTNALALMGTTFQDRAIRVTPYEKPEAKASSVSGGKKNDKRVRPVEDGNAGANEERKTKKQKKSTP